MKKSYYNHFLELLLATLLISTSGVLGKYIALDPPVIIWCRSFLAFLVLLLYCKYKGINIGVKSNKDIPSLLLSGILLAAHWVTYFYALKLSNVSIGVLSLYTFPIITTLLEPFFAKSKLSFIQVILGVFVLIGIYILVPEFSLDSGVVKGIICGLFSALFYSLRTLLLKPYMKDYNGIVIMLHQTAIVSVILIPCLFFMNISEIPSQFPYLLLLAILTTAIGHTLFVRSLRYFLASTASIISSLQPIFGIILAFIFLNEIPTFNIYIGGSIILFTVFVESLRSK